MINILIADDNVEYAINLMNYINEESEDIRVCKIAKNGKETLEIVNNTDNIDIIILDYNMPFYNGEEILNNIKDKEKYNNSCIIISGDLEPVIELRKNELIYCGIYKTIATSEILRKIKELLEYKKETKKIKMLNSKIVREILYLGYDISHKGTQYLIKTINYVANNQNGNIQNLEKDIYPKVAMRYNETVHNVKCRINRATNSMYYNCDINRLKEYFTFETDSKPKIKTIINTIVRNIM